MQTVFLVLDVALLCLWAALLLDLFLFFCHSLSGFNVLEQIYLMRQYNVKTLLLPVVAGVAFLWFGGKAVFELWGYSRLDKHTPVAVLDWQIVERGSRAYILGSYTFEAQGKIYQGKTRFREPTFLNKLAAGYQLDEWKTHAWSAWYDPKNPECSSLQKLFPYKNCVYALLVMGVLGYFTGMLFRGRF